jgi:predicted ribosome quality control (RQC) complex YloA/Tae2 family protein
VSDFSPFVYLNMAYDYYTVKALAAELDAAMTGAIISGANKRSAVLVFGCNEIERSLMAQCRRGGDLRLLKKGPGGDRATINGAEKYLVGAKVCAVVADHSDRIVRIHLERRNRTGDISRGVLVFELMANKLNCALISERTGEILGVWGDEKRMRVGSSYQLPKGSRRFVPGESDLSEFLARAGTIDGTLPEKCRKLWVGLDRQTLLELVDRAGFVEDRPDLGADLDVLWEIASGFATECLDGKFYVYLVKDQWHFTAIEPKRLKGSYSTYTNLSEAIAEVAQKNQTQIKKDQSEQRITGLLRREIKSIERRLAALRRDLKEAESAELLEKHGHILLAHLDSVPSGLSPVELTDIFDPTGEAVCLIELDRQKTPAENAAALLKRAKKYGRRLQLLPKRIRGVEREGSELRGNLLLVEEGQALNPVEDWLRERGYLKTMDKGDKKTQERGGQAHPRQYTTSDGWRVLAGRNNKENDVLTHKMAAQNDMWFHAHGYPGSHVILKREGRKDEPSKQTLEEAAAIAAFWSKGKSAKKVPVVYTLAKYVSKPRGGAPGQAVLKREKTLIVEPQIPKTKDDA